nr:reverse transcriptase domain-containing protein [Tanacetum cinerariifolium]
MSQKAASSSIDSSRNDETPSRRGSNHSKEQQIGPDLMCYGLRTRKESFGYQANSGRKIQDGNKSRISEANNIFAWMPTDMIGVPRHIAKHPLNIREGCPPIRQKKRGQAADRNQAIQEEVGKLVEAGIMKEVHYHDWLSNPVMIKKHDGSWRMCVDFKE